MRYGLRKPDRILFFLLLSGFLFLATVARPTIVQAQNQALAQEDLARLVAAASRPNPPWDGPYTGPPAQPGKMIAIISDDLRNGGILGVAQGVREAAKEINWQIKLFDAGGTEAGRDKAAAEALATKADGLILIGTDAQVMRQRLLPFVRRGVPIVGWHVGPKAGPLSDMAVAFNVSTDPLEVARITAAAAVVAAGGRAGVVIFTDSNYAIALAKSDAMAKVIRACKDCSLLEIRDLAIAQCAEKMPATTRELLQRYGSRWTYALAINDIYFDYAAPELITAGEAGDNLHFLSAGDGSAAAFMRIGAGAFQLGTVAEPLNLHGWQLVDELNRLLAQQPVSSYIVPVHLVTPENVAYDGGPGFQFDPDNGYREVYRRIWQP